MSNEVMKNSVQSVVVNSIMKGEFKELAPADQGLAFGLLDLLKKKIETRLKEIKPVVQDTASLLGKLPKPDSKSLKWLFESGEVSLTLPEAKPVVDLDKLKAVLAKKDKRLEDACDVKKDYTPNASKLELLVEDGVLTPDELKGCEVTPDLAPRLSVKLNSDVLKSLGE